MNLIERELALNDAVDRVAVNAIALVQKHDRLVAQVEELRGCLIWLIGILDSRDVPTVVVEEAIADGRRALRATEPTP